MTATVTDLAKWREDHPPAVRLLNIWLQCGAAGLRLYAAWWRAVITLPLR